MLFIGSALYSRIVLNPPLFQMWNFYRMPMEFCVAVWRQGLILTQLALPCFFPTWDKNATSQLYFVETMNYGWSPFFSSKMHIGIVYSYRSNLFNIWAYLSILILGQIAALFYSMLMTLIINSAYVGVKRSCCVLYV